MILDNLDGIRKNARNCPGHDSATRIIIQDTLMLCDAMEQT